MSRKKIDFTGIIFLITFFVIICTLSSALAARMMKTRLVGPYFLSHGGDGAFDIDDDRQADSLYDKSDLIAVVRVLEVTENNRQPQTPYLTCRVRVEESIRPEGRHEPLEFPITFHAFELLPYQAKVGERLLVFLKRYPQGVNEYSYWHIKSAQEIYRIEQFYPINSLNRVKFSWFPNNPYQNFEGVEIPNMPLDRNIALIKSILKLPTQNRTVDQIRTLSMNEIYDLDPYDLFNEDLEYFNDEPYNYYDIDTNVIAATWGVRTLQAMADLGLPNANAALMRLEKKYSWLSDVIQNKARFMGSTGKNISNKPHSGQSNTATFVFRNEGKILWTNKNVLMNCYSVIPVRNRNFSAQLSEGEVIAPGNEKKFIFLVNVEPLNYTNSKLVTSLPVSCFIIGMIGDKTYPVPGGESTVLIPGVFILSY